MKYDISRKANLFIRNVLDKAEESCELNADFTSRVNVRNSMYNFLILSM
jgi:hypothetical protein